MFKAFPASVAAPLVPVVVRVSFPCNVAGLIDVPHAVPVETAMPAGGHSIPPPVSGELAKVRTGELATRHVLKAAESADTLPATCQLPETWPSPRTCNVWGLPWPSSP